MAQPALQRLVHVFVGRREMSGVDPNKGGGARSAIQEFVAAANGKVGIRTRQIQRHRTRAVRQVPYGERARLLRCVRDGVHVEHRASPVVHMGQHQHRNILRERRSYRLCIHQLQSKTMGAAQTLGHVQISRKVASLAHYQLAML